MNLNDHEMEAIVAKAIVDSLTPEKRQELIAQAVKDLISKPTGSGFNKSTMLQEVFNSAVRTVAERIAYDQMANDPGFQARVKALFTEVAEKFFGGDGHAELVQKMASAMASAMTRDRY